MDQIEEWMAIAGKTKYKTIIMVKRIPKVLYFIFFAAAVILIIYKFYLRNQNRNEEAQTAQWIALGLLLAALLCRFLPKIFPKKFGDKPAREEMEQNVFGDKSSER